MKTLFFPLVIAGSLALSGCAVVAPYDDGYVAYSSAPYTYYDAYGRPYAPYAYGPPSIYGAPVYIEPPVRFSFSLNYRGGHGHHGHGFGGRGGFRGNFGPGHHGGRGGRSGGWRR